MGLRDHADRSPGSVRHDVRLPRRQQYQRSPASWRDEVIYFLLVDRFSDGAEAGRPLVDRRNRPSARPPIGGEPWRWDRWWQSGRERWQGGTIAGVSSKLGYLQDLGVTAVWLSPVFKQRSHLDTFHGYGIQDFLDVDPRFGTRRDLVQLVDAAHDRDLRVILDVIFNHSGMNWVYAGGHSRLPYTPGRHDFGSWLGDDGSPVAMIDGPDDGVWPTELQEPEAYTRAGSANLGEGSDIGDPWAEHKRGDFEVLRDFDLGRPGVLDDLARCYKYWIGLTGCDGFRIDTVKHVAFEDARNFCGAIKEYALNLGIDDFLLLAEVAGGDRNARRYLEVVGQNLDAALDIGEARPTLTAVAKGLERPGRYLDVFRAGQGELGSHRVLGDRHVSILDDHDHVMGTKLRFSVDAQPEERQVVVGVAIQLFTLGIPCLYYGTEQALSGPEESERTWLAGWGSHDQYLREAMFGPEHPRAGGLAGNAGALDTELPGFGPFGTAGAHCFDRHSPAFGRIQALLRVRRDHAVLRHGRQYEREIRSGQGFGYATAGQPVAWSRILDDEEAVCVANPDGSRSVDVEVTVDSALNRSGEGSPAVFTVVANTGLLGGASGPGGPGVGSTVPVQWDGGRAYVAVRALGPAEVAVLVNHPAPDEGAVTARR